MSLQYFKPPVVFDNNITATKGFSVFGTMTALDLFINSVTVSGNISATQSIFALSGNSNSWNTAFQRTSANDIVRSNSTFETPTTGISAINNIVALSQTAYNALTIKLPATLYVII